MPRHSLAVLALLLLPQPQPGSNLRADVEALNAAMVAAFTSEPASVAAHYTDDAALIGGGQRHQGRAAVDAYWRGASTFTRWSLAVLETGGPPHAPWQYGRSVLTGRSGRTMETYFIGLLRRQPAGGLKFQVDAFTRETGSSGEPEAAKLTEAWLQATGRGDAQALHGIFDEQYVLLSSTGVRNREQEIAELVRRPGTPLPYFRSERTQTRAFGSLAVTTGLLKWRVQPEGPEAQRHYASIAVRRPEGWRILAQQITPVAPVPGPPDDATLPASAADARATPTAQANASVVEAIAAAVEQRYVFPEIGTRIAAHLRDQARRGAYEGLDAARLADALTRDLRAQNGDRHLYVQYQSGAGRGAAGQPVRQTPGTSPASLDLARRRNYYLNRAERLDGNVGYLEVRRFFGQREEAREAVAGAMAFLAQTDAMIVDVRHAPGGDAGMVDLLASYFFDRVRPTLSSFLRTRNETVHRTTLANVPGKRRPDIPLYVLTSRDTGSAAEDFAFLLQQTGRATLVGDRTAGAGHMNALLMVGGGYTLSVSIGRTFNPETNQGWEGTGVVPAVQVAPREALNAAHRLALTALIEKAATATVKEELTWSRDTLDARRAPPTIAPETLARYAGRYGTRLVGLDDGRLWYQRDENAERTALVTLSATEFAAGEGQRLQFVVNGGAIQLRLLMTDGTYLAFERDR